MAKRLIVCSDGTWASPDLTAPFEITNVAKIARTVLPEAPDGTRQVVFYDRGVGTGNLLDRLSGGIFGVGLSQNVKDAYRFLVEHYESGDTIHFFGFSRGAYTVRSAAGFIRKCGLLRKQDAGLISKAFQLYRRRDPDPDSGEAKKFRRLHGSQHPVPIAFVGVWDTVGALGIPVDLPGRLLSRLLFDFHDVAPTRQIEHACQALAIDERRLAFMPTLWEQHPRPADQRLEQVWFAGGHLDVGGGLAGNPLSDITLLWMKERAASDGLAFDEASYEQIGVQPLAPIHPAPALLPYSRPIGEAPRAHESVHWTALERYERDRSYRPCNLVRYLEQHPELRERRPAGIAITAR